MHRKRRVISVKEDGTQPAGGNGRAGEDGNGENREEGKPRQAGGKTGTGGGNSAEGRETGRREEEEGGRYIAVDKSLFGNGNKTRITRKTRNKAVYTACVAPSRPKKYLVTIRRADHRTDRRTDRRTHPHVERERDRMSLIEETFLCIRQFH